MQGVSFQIENLSLLMTNEIRYRGANMGFVLFNQNTNNDDKNIETNFIFAHEVAAGYYGDTYHEYDKDEDYNGMERNYFCQLSEEQQKCVHQSVTQNLPSIYVF